MNRTVFALVFPVVMLASSVLQADLVYAFENHLSDQNGHTVLGTITTTDAAVNDGLLLASEVLSWQWSVVGVNGSSVSSTDTDATLFIEGDVSISTGEITLQQPNIMSDMQYSLEIGSNADGRMSWVRQESFGTFNETYQGANGWAASSPTMSNTAPSDPWLVATRVTTVPEPSSFSCLVATGLFLLRRKKSL